MSKLTPGISFVVAAYNVEKTLERCISSIQIQTLKSIEILIVNDRSTDSTLDLASRLASRDPLNRTICLSHIRNMGLPAVRNTGFESSTNKYIWHIDGDDYVASPHAAEIVFNLLEENQLPAIKVDVFQETEASSFQQQNNIHLCYSDRFSIVHPSEIEYQYGHGGAFSVIYSREVAKLLRIQNLEGISIGEDQILNVQLFRSLPAIGLLRIPLYIYDKTGESMMRNKWQLERFLQDRLYVHFLCNALSDTPNRANHALMQRTRYILNKMLERSKEELNDQQQRLIRYLWIDDSSRLQNSNAEFSLPNKQLQTKYENLQEEVRNNPPDWGDAFYDLFKDTKFIVHIGAHKTATTFVQNILEGCRYNLALNGTIVINYLDLRREIKKIQQDSVKNHTSIKISAIEVYRIIVQLSARLLFAKPRRVIISDENLLLFNNQFRKKNYNSSMTCACMRSGYQLTLLEDLISVLPDCTVIYTIRSYADYVQSQYLERLKWHPFTKFSDFCGENYTVNNVSWLHVIGSLLACVKSHNAKLEVYKFEDFKSNPILFASCLAGEQLDETLLQDNSLAIRQSPTEETYKLLKNQASSLSEKSFHRLYQKLLAYEYGTKRLRLFSMEDEGILSKKYEIHLSQLSLSSIFVSKKTNAAKLPSLQSFQDLTSSILATTMLDNTALADDIDLNQAKTDYRLSFAKYKKIKNIEGISEFNCQFSFLPNKETGITALLRVKNEEKNIRMAIAACKKVFDKIIIVDNNSTDKTLPIIQEMIDVESSSDRIKLFSYPFQVAKCGVPNFQCDEKSVHSLAYFYNYALSCCQTSAVFKWDADMLLTDKMTEYLGYFLDEYRKKVCKPSGKLILGKPRGITVYRGYDGKNYYFPAQVEKEVRIFENIAYNIYIKDILWERLHSSLSTEVIESKQPVFIEYKDVSQEEFSHWNPGSLGMGMRKRLEYKNYKTIERLTLNSVSPSDEQMYSNGFKQYNEKII